MHEIPNPTTTPRRRARRRHGSAAPLLAILGAVLLAILPPAPLAAQEPQRTPAVSTPDPFYLQLLEEGILTYQRGAPGIAAEDLRLATFGLLDHPPELVRGLVYLALARASQDDGREAARETLERLLVIEDRFRVYADLELPEAAKAALADLMRAEVPEAALLASATFRSLGEDKLQARLDALPPKERRRALAEQVERRPGDARWLLALGTLELELGDPAAAAGRAARVLAADPPEEPARLAEARCLRGLALATTGSCAAAVPDLQACPRSRTDAKVAFELVSCQAELGTWRAAAASLDALPVPVRNDRILTRLERQVAREVDRLPAATSASGDTAGGGEAGTGEPAALPAPAREQLAEARRRLAAATRTSDLAEPLRMARQVADAHPGAREAQHLVGEIAYRASDWPLAVRYFRRGGPTQRPEQGFYLAVALFESGETTEAARILEGALPDLPRSPFVNSYVERIRGTGP